jgi:phospholipid/cholesterol/gamma-HCH transport system substrate-binding protein
MTEHGNELRVGVTLAIAGAVLVIGVLWLSEFQFGDERYQLSVVFPEVAGLVPGDKVTVAGLSAGEVLTLDLERSAVVVSIEVDNNIRIPVDSRISVASYGLIGAKIVAIRPGMAAELIEPGSRVTGYYEKALGDVVSEMGEALTEIRLVLHTADQVLTDVDGRERVMETLGNARDATLDLKVAVADIKVVAAEIRAFVEAEKGGVSSTIESVGEASADFAEITAELKTISASLDSIVTRVEAGEGSLGKLVNDEDAYDEFVQAITEVRDLVAAIRENPKSFVRFSIW